ncbi:DUF763 domain-containing protein [Marinoscillum furvescens]|uniref:DUF763 domain-containing protein n=1 Tax=Marinoscillum furvescens DSM 4134 TaxID=1122208 RepID=A0A3D9KYP9_MARFU|nr:DUF763 domain-containing protein [Marinoscillum furvescens]RED94415.1 hypothetical protein C7460_121102 [Marinoscillum furvescens DSM 4134]
MKRRGHADLPLHGGKVPKWLAERMSLLGGAIVEAILVEYGKKEVIARLSDPAWFQSLGCVLGMDWHSSGITTSVIGALKTALNPKAKELGIYICGGRGKHSRKTPAELTSYANQTGLNAAELVRNSKLTAKVDNTAIQDGFQIYLHSFILSDEGDWAVVQQGMDTRSGYARRYHWLGGSFRSFTETPHQFIYGENKGPILNLTARNARNTKNHLLEMAAAPTTSMLREIQHIKFPAHHDVRQKDVDIRRLGTVLAMAKDLPTQDFESLLLLEGMGPRTLQSLALVSEVIYGTPTRFSDPARFSFAHGGKDGHPFPVPTHTYDESIAVLRKAIDKARIGNTDKLKAVKSLKKAASQMENDFVPKGNLQDVIENERNNSWKYGGRTVNGHATPPSPQQLDLFN